MKASAKGVFTTGCTADDDYRVYAQIGTAKSNNILIAVAPGVVGALSRTVKKGANYDVDYRFIVEGDANDTLNGDYLIQAR